MDLLEKKRHTLIIYLKILLLHSTSSVYDILVLQIRSILLFSARRLDPIVIRVSIPIPI